MTTRSFDEMVVMLMAQVPKSAGFQPMWHCQILFVSDHMTFSSYCIEVTE